MISAHSDLLYHISKNLSTFDKQRFGHVSRYFKNNIHWTTVDRQKQLFFACQVDIVGDEEHLVAFVDRLLCDPDVDPSVDDSVAVCFTSGNGHASVVRRLLRDERVNPSTYGSHALRIACRNGHVEVARILLQHKLIKADLWALKAALERGQDAIVKLLLADGRFYPFFLDNKLLRLSGRRR